MAIPNDGAQEAARIREYYLHASWRSSLGRHWFVAERRTAISRVVRDLLIPHRDLRVCDVGCGAGADLVWWKEQGVASNGLHGTELNHDRAAAARLVMPEATIAAVDGFTIPFPDSSMHVVMASLVISSILDEAGRVQLLEEMLRITRPRGVIAVYDFRVRKPWNRSVRPLRPSWLASQLGAPSIEVRMGPLLPILDLALRLPGWSRAPLIRALPRTHSLWIWRT